MKQKTAIEQLLRWAYHQELPKEHSSTTFLRPLGFGGAWGSVTKLGLLGTEVQEPDVRNRYGIVPDTTAQSEPHPDAVQVWQEVQALAGIGLDLPEDWNPISDFGDLGPLGAAAIVKGIGKRCAKDAQGNVHLRLSIEQLVEHHIIMSSIPDWRFEQPEQKLVRHANGTPRYFIRDVVSINGENIEVEGDGFDKVQRRPKIGSYTKPYLDPDPVEAVVARIDYRIWHSAMELLVERLSGRLDSREPVSTLEPEEPWITGARPTARTLPSLVGSPSARRSYENRRAGLPLERGSAGPVRQAISEEDRARGYVMVAGKRMPLIKSG